jgi:broad specificity phosphatase PhoE
VQLWLSRHGQTAWNLERRYQGQGDSGMTTQGEREARCLGQRLAAAPIDIVYTSDLERAWRTAELAMTGRDIPIVRDPAWREVQYGAWEGLTRAEVKARYPDLWRQRASDKAGVAPPGGESLLQLQERVLHGGSIGGRTQRGGRHQIDGSALAGQHLTGQHGDDGARELHAAIGNGRADDPPPGNHRRDLTPL